MQTFIDQIVELVNSSQLPEYDICIVVPNRRAGLFLKQKLIPSGDSPRWLPAIQTIEDFVFSTSKLTEPDSVSLLAMLYKAHCRDNPDQVSFDNFLSWGSEILRDFEEVDQYLADPEQLFEYVKDAREIDVWTPGESMTPFEKSYLDFYRSLNCLYQNFRKELVQRNLGYQGIATRLIAENPQDYLPALAWKKIIFAGFNAFTPSQLKIIKYLISQEKAEVIFDADDFYMDNPVMEAGTFLRKYNKDEDLIPLKVVNSNFIRTDRNIYVCGVPGNTGQARIAGSILSRISPEKYNKTALVLADESLLLPVLNALPASQENFNVTMGFPLIHTPLFSLADAFMKLYLNAVSPGVFYHADVTAVLQNTHLKNLMPAGLRNKIAYSIRKNNYSYITITEIKRLAEEQKPEAIDLIFAECHEPGAVLKALTQLLAELKGSLDQDESSSNEEVLYTLWQKTLVIRNSIEKEGIEIGTMATLYNFFREVCSSTRVPFYGEPLKGIQIMGMLETRMLDFENVILLSVNEDILPSSKNNKSFIPIDIRRHYGLPAHHERQAVFAYHFYRLLQRPQNAWLIYNHDGDQLDGGEKSRYIRQLEWELPEKGIYITTLTVDDSTLRPVQQPLTIVKDDYVMRVLREKAEKGFSFSSLKQYLNCQLAFYYSYVLKLEETEEVEEDISTKTMGIILHGILEDIYKDFTGRTTDPGTLKNALERVGELIHAKTASHFPALKIDSGHNLLFIKVAEIWLHRFLKSEIECIIADKEPLIKGTESPFTRKLKIELQEEEPFEVTLYGKIDRIDVLDGKLRVIDYKTGKVNQKDTRFSAVEDLFNPLKDNGKQLQLCYYKYLAMTNPENQSYDILPGIISFRALGKGFIPLEGKFSEEEFEENLKVLIGEIFNREINFSQTGIKYCRYCNFQHICHKEVN
ncbi:MAG TPA: PD-(D/E)XK nuclease family protein [Lentimicrobium sp.]|nr:PD-(D/E)XK nuclease family protein [Lentimicrobium sp.]